MGTNAQAFVGTNTDQDFTAPSEGRILKLAPTGTWTGRQTNHPSAAGTTDITLDPGANRSTQGEVTANYGWSINRAGADGMEATPSTRRRILAGSWTVSMACTVPNAGATTGSHQASFVAYLYKVDASGNRTLLFTSGRSSVVQTALTFSQSGTCTVTFDPGEIILEADETIHVGLLCRNVQVAGALGVTTAGNISWSNAQVQVASPGIRDRNLMNPTATLDLSSVRQPWTIGLHRDDLKAQVDLVSAQDELLTLPREFSVNASLDAAYDEFLLVSREFATDVTLDAARQPWRITLGRDDLRTGLTLDAVRQSWLILLGRADLRSTLTLTPSFAKLLQKVVTAGLLLTAAYDEVVTLFRQFSTSITLAASWLVRIPQAVLNRMTGGGGGTTIIKRIVHLFED